jgi:2-methylcitrate dehydratase PrpD
MLSALALHKSRKGQATVWGSELRVDRRSAALVNGVSANPTIRDEHSRYDDIGAVIIPALIAWAEGRSTPATGLELLHACIMGYEVVGRMQAAWGGSAAIKTHVPKPGAYNVYGAATAVCLIHRAKAGALAQALAIACAYAGGTQYSTDSSHTQKLQTGRAAEGGYMAAQLTATGYSGTTAVFDPVLWDSAVQPNASEHAGPTALSADYGVCWHVDTAFGSPSCTLDETAVTASFMDLVGPVIPVQQAEALVVAVNELPSALSIQPLIDLLSVSV